MARYEWRKPADSPDRLELVDRAASRPVVIISRVGRHWKWYRATSILLHGAPPAQGESRTLTSAKTRALEGLPENA
jgi:hypothetical protein